MTHPASGPDGPGFTDLGFARPDTDRATRTGTPEVVFAEHKPVDQTATLLRTLHAAHPDRAVLATRIRPEDAAPLADALRDLAGVELDAVSRTAVVGPL